ncbi:hypothetical protein [Microbacterium sp.]|uniref:hypothetical protein n=1 Tax=Microbacterium sp. TaxID=51671 RepID=UPI003F96B8AB
MITSTLVMPAIAISTVATIIYISLGFLPRPSRAGVQWSAAFGIAMIGSYVWLTQDFVHSEQLYAIGSGLTISPMPLVWSGLRAYRGLNRQFAPLSISFAVVAPAFLLASTYAGLYEVAYRILFCAATVFAVLIVFELVRLGPQLRGEALPLMAVSAAFVVFGAFVLFNGVLVATGIVDGSASTEFLRTFNLIGMTVYLVCALTTTLLLTTRAESSPAPHHNFERTARRRLERARAAEDQWWSMLDIRLDDPDDIRRASAVAAFNAVTDKFARDVDTVFPADADIEQIRPDCFVVLVPRPQGGVRDLLTELLERISAPDSVHALPLRLSASIGWAPVSAAGYDFDALVDAASKAAGRAYASGGDRWERVRAATE